MFSKVINFCEKTKATPKVALAIIGLMFYGNSAEDQEIFNYCDDWVKENGDITYKNIKKYIKDLGYIGEIVEISSKFNWDSSDKF